MKTPKVGQTVYSLNVGNAARHNEQVLTPVVVTKVGRKYFTVGEGWRATQFHISDWSEKTEYSPCAALYESEQEWLDEKESGDLCREIARAFEYGKNSRDLPLSSLREIGKILGLPISVREQESATP